MNKGNFQSIQIRAQEHSDAIKKIFTSLLQNWTLCKGFIGFEDAQQMISIFHSSSENAKYYHMRSDEGFTGYVYGHGDAMILDVTNPEHKKFLVRPEDPERELSEMVATIHYRKSGELIEKAGVILIDMDSVAGFTEEDLIKLKKAAKNIGDILSNVNPWKLRSWSAKYEHDCTKEYTKDLKISLQERLAKYSGISLKVELVDGGHLRSPEYFYSSSKSGSHYQKVSDTVMEKGTSHYDPNLVTQGVLGVPFPINGPIKGVISVERLKPTDTKIDEKHEVEKIRKDVIEVIESMDYSLFKKVYDTNDAGLKMFSFLNKCISGNQPLFEALNELCREFGEIDDATIELHLPSYLLKEDNNYYEFIKQSNDDDLKVNFIDNKDYSSRPRFQITKVGSRDVIKCGVFYGHKLVGGIRAIPKTAEIAQSDSDGPIIETFSTFISRLLARHIRSKSFKDFLVWVRTTEKISESEFLDKALQILRCNYLVRITTKPSDQEILDQMMERSDELDKRKISLDEMQNFLNLFNPPIEKLMVVNKSNSLDDLKKHDQIKNLKDLQLQMSEFAVRSFCIQRIDDSNILLAVIHRDKSFKELFDQEDQNIIETFATLHKLLINLEKD